ncbi:MAG: hypothetical protein R3E10_16960 [Gemmatimonadota bacterium]
MTSGRSGAAGIEWVLGVLLAVLVLAMGFQGMARLQRALTHATARSELESAFAAVTRILGDELRAGVPGRDWWVYPPDSVAVRAFRGTATVCAARGAELTVSFRGDRVAVPAKDSVLVLDGDSRWSVAALTRVGPSSGPCGNGRPERWVLDRSIPDATVVRLYERGVYILAGGTLRYRRGAAGRQPLTYARLDSLGSRLTSGSASVGLVLSGIGGGSAGLVRSPTLRARNPLP